MEQLTHRKDTNKDAYYSSTLDHTRLRTSRSAGRRQCQVVRRWSSHDGYGVNQVAERHFEMAISLLRVIPTTFSRGA